MKNTILHLQFEILWHQQIGMQSFEVFVDVCRQAPYADYFVQKIPCDFSQTIGQALNRLNEIEPAQTIVHSVINEAIMAIRKAQRFIEVI